MSEMLLNIFVYLFAIWGVASLIINFFDSTFSNYKGKGRNARMVLIVKDQEDTIEGMVRNIFTSGTLRKVVAEEKLIVVDMNSKDETVAILNKLKKTYEVLELVTEKEKDIIFSEFENT